MDRQLADSVTLHIREALRDILTENNLTIDIQGAFTAAELRVTVRLNEKTNQLSKLERFNLKEGQEFSSGGKLYKLTGETAPARRGFWVLAERLADGRVYKFRPEEIQGNERKPTANPVGDYILENLGVKIGQTFMTGRDTYRITGTRKGRRTHWILAARTRDNRNFRFTPAAICMYVRPSTQPEANGREGYEPQSLDGKSLGTLQVGPNGEISIS